MVYRVGVSHLSRFLHEVDIFRELSQRELDRVAALCEERSFRAGEVLCRKGERGSELYVVRSGEIRVTIGAEAKDIVVRTIRAHETMALASLFEPPLLVTTAVAATDVEALVIPRVRMIELCELEPAIGAKIYRAACGVIMDRYRYMIRALSEQATPAMQIGPSPRGAEV